MAVGNPAKVVGYKDKEDPSLTMKHDARRDYFEHVAVSFSDDKANGSVVK
jgi:serine O-acetyltransferase